MRDIDLLLRNGVTIAELAAVFAAIGQGELATMFQRAGPLEVGLYRRLAGRPAAVIRDFFALPVPNAPTAQQISTWYGNFLTLPGGPGAYNANNFTTFSQELVGPPRRYHDFTAGARRSMADAYDQYVRANGGANQDMAQFAAAIYANGQNLTWNTGQLAAVVNWSANASNAATQRELTQVGGLPAIHMAYSQQVHDAISVIQQNMARATALVGNDANKMRVLLTVLGGAPHVDMLRALQIYERDLELDPVLTNNNAPAPVYGAAWELAFAQAIHGLAVARRHAVKTWLRADLTRLNIMRAQLHAIDGSGAPNFAALWGALGQVLGNNQPQFGTLLSNADLVMRAMPHEYSVNLPFSNRAGGLNGHFQKHVLGVDNIDQGEPARWINQLNLQGVLTRNHLGAISDLHEVVIFLRNNVPGGTALTAQEITRLIGLCQGGAASQQTLAALTNAFANTYHQAVANAYDNSTGSYLYVQGGRVKINTHNGVIFAVSAFDNGAFDLSSGYIPQMGAQAKWGVERDSRLWEH